MDKINKQLETLAGEEVKAVTGALPPPLAERARQVPVIFKWKPDPDEEDDLLGLFTGAELACESNDPSPTQIILFLENLWDEAERSEPNFQHEVRITYLHELGHYLGLDEDDLFARGLE